MAAQLSLEVPSRPITVHQGANIEVPVRLVNTGDVTLGDVRIDGFIGSPGDQVAGFVLPSIVMDDTALHLGLNAPLGPGEDATFNVAIFGRARLFIEHPTPATVRLTITSAAGIIDAMVPVLVEPAPAPLPPEPTPPEGPMRFPRVPAQTPVLS